MISDVSGAVLRLAGPPTPGDTAARAQADGEAVRQVKADNGGDSNAKAASLRHEVSRLNEYLRQTRRDLAFRVDEGTGRVVITVSNPATQEVIRQIPPQRLLELAEDLEQHGLLVKDLA